MTTKLAKKKTKSKKAVSEGDFKEAILALGEFVKVMKECMPPEPHYMPQDENPVYHEEPTPINLDEHYEAMRQAFCDTIRSLEEWYLMIDAKTYAVACRRVTFNIKIEMNQKSMQPYEREEDRTFCAVRIFAWGANARQDGLVEKLQSLGAEVKDVYVAEDIRAALGAT